QITHVCFLMHCELCVWVSARRLNFSDSKHSKAEHKQRMTLHCQQCNTVLGDSLGVCGEITCVDAIVCISNEKTRVFWLLEVMTEMFCSGSHLLSQLLFPFSIYSSLTCRGCRCAVGKVIHSAPSRLATVRSMFLLYKANISCYILDCCSMVKASTLTFDVKPLSESMNKVRQGNLILFILTAKTNTCMYNCSVLCSHNNLSTVVTCE
uniref:Mis18 domain-containing protein n=1 Tax=Sander lucioperca TaxID=283035 RepID=A0A8C9X2C3_SANLU